MSTAAFIQARVGSTRLPGKVLADIAGRPVLERVVRRVSEVPEIDDIAVLTSEQPGDDAILELCSDIGVTCIRGSEHDVLGRFQKASELMRPASVVRITADCPLLDPNIVSELIGLFRREVVDLATVAAGEPPEPTLRRFPRGLDAEILTAAALGVAASEAQEQFDREHVTPFLWRRPERFKIAHLESDRDLSNHRWSLEDDADLALIRSLYGRLPDPDGPFGLDELLSMIEK
jgi:spore coat polysaccharide biosynthesis protein SpsF